MFSHWRTIPAFWLRHKRNKKMRFSLRERLLDSYSHYRRQVGLGRTEAVYRTLYFEVRRREPLRTTRL